MGFAGGSGLTLHAVFTIKVDESCSRELGMAVQPCMIKYSTGLDVCYVRLL